MEPLTPPPRAPNVATDPRDHLDDLLAGRVDRSDIDVRSFLLDPPPTAEEAERIERRRRIVRRGSIAGAALVAVVLVAPIPRSGQDRGARAGAESNAPIAAVDRGAGMDDPVGEPAELTAPGADPGPAADAVRLDAPAPVRGRTRAHRSTPPPAGGRRGATRPATTSTSKPSPSSSSAGSSSGAGAASAPRPTAPAPAPAPRPTATDGAIVAPVA